MKKTILLLFSLLSLFSCEDVIDVETPTDSPRLVIDALIRVNENSPLTTITVNLGVTGSFFDNLEPVTVDQVTITNVDQPNTLVSPNKISLQANNPGTYQAIVNTSFLTEGKLVLLIEYNEQVFVANANYVPSTPINSLIQGEETLFAGNETEIIVNFTDLPDRDDYYLLDFDFFEYLVTEDLFYKGQDFEFSYFYDEKVTKGMEIKVNILGINFDFFNYMNLVINQSAGGSQGPFQIPTATIKGNVINLSNISPETIDLSNLDLYNDQIDTENFALGYFAVSQFYEETIIIE